MISANQRAERSKHRATHTRVLTCQDAVGLADETVDFREFGVAITNTCQFLYFAQIARFDGHALVRVPNVLGAGWLPLEEACGGADALTYVARKRRGSDQST